MEKIFKGEGTKVQQLADYIQREVSSNGLKVGDALPSINYFSKQFSVSRDTVFKSFSDLKARGIIDSVQGKNYFVASRTKSILLLLDEYSPFKEVLYNTLVASIPTSYTIDLWFHQYNEHLFNKIVSESIGKYSKYLVMNYDNEFFSDILRKIDKNRLLLLDFGNFDKTHYSYVCQDFAEGLYQSLLSIKHKMAKYKKMVFVINRKHNHPEISKQAFTDFCLDNGFEFRVLDEVPFEPGIQKDHFYLVIKDEDIVKIIKQGRQNDWEMGKDYGLLAYNENPFYEIVDDGISSIGINWLEMGDLAAQYVLTGKTVQTYLTTNIITRSSY